MGLSLPSERMFLSRTIFLSCLPFFLSSEDVSDNTEGYKTGAGPILKFYLPNFRAREREGKVWYISTTTTSTTVSTTTLCMQLAAITDLVPPCTGKKKKRSYFFDENPTFTDEVIDPSFFAKDEEDFKLDSGVVDMREGKFLNPWMTITTTNTRTTYTATSTIATVVCTPDGWSIRMCNLSG